MATRVISTRLAIEGESQYKQALKDINSNLGTLNSNLKLTKSEFQNHQNTLEALQATNKSLTAVQEELQKKVQKCGEAYNNAKTQMDKYQSAIEKNQTALKQVNSALDSMDSSVKQSGQQWLQYKDKISDAEKQLKELENTSGDTSEQEAKLRKEIEEARQAMDKLDTETDGAASSAGELLEQQRDLTSELDKAEAGYNAAQKSVNQWQKEENNAKIQLNNVNAELENNERYMKEAEQATDGCANSIDEFGNKTDKAADGAQALYSVLAGAGLAKAVSALADAFMECVNKAAEFEQQMSTVQAISGASGEDMQKLTELAKEMGATTSFTAKEAGEGLEYMAMAGWKTEDMLNGLSGIMDLAAASGEDLGTTSDIVTDALTAFGLSAADSAHFSDILASASSNANTNVSMMGETFKYCAPLFGTMGYSAEDAAIAIGLMANAGIKGSQAGTTLRSGLTNLIKPSTEAKNAMDEYGITLTNSSGEMMSFREVMEELREKMGSLSATEQSTAASAIFGKEAMSGWLNIINASQNDFDKLTASVDGCEGAATRMANTRLDNFAGQCVLLESAVDGLKTEIGSQFTPILTEMAKVATDAFSWMTDVVADHPGLMTAITGIVTVIGTLGGAMVILAATHIPAVTGALGTLATAFKTVFGLITAHPIGALITALAALGVGIGAAVAQHNAQKEAMMVEKQAAESLTETLESQATAYSDVVAANAEAATSTQALANSVIELASSAQSSALDHEALLDTISQLNEAVPNLGLAYDETTGSLNMSTDAILQQVEAQNSLNEAQAEVDRYNELLQDQNTIELQLQEVQEKRADAQARLREEEGLSRQEKKELKISIEDCEAAEEAYTEQLEATTAAIEEMKPRAEELAASLKNTGTSADQVTSVAQNLATEIANLGVAYNNTLTDCVESMEGQANAWDTLDETVAMTSEDIFSALESQIQHWQEYDANIQTIMSSGSEYAQRVVTAYQGNAEAIAGISQMTKEEIDALGMKLDERSQSMVSAAQTVADSVTGFSNSAMETIENAKAIISDPANTEEMKQAAFNMLQGFANGIDESGAEVDAETQAAAQAVIDMFKEMLGIQSPSTVFEEIGQNTMAGYIQGINGKDGETQTTMQQAAQDALNAFKNILNVNALPGTGSDTMKGYQSGVNGQTGATNTTMSNIAKNAMNSFKGVANTGSLNGAGVQTMQGYNTGANGQSSAVNSTLKNLALNALNSFKGVATNSALTQSGTQTAQGFSSGANAQSNSAATTLRNLATNALNAVKNSATSSSLYGSGTSVIQGFINGASAMGSSLYSRLRSLASNALASFKRTLGIASPSKEFAKAGQFSMQGFIQGVAGDEGAMRDTMSKMAKSASQSFSSELDYDTSRLNAIMNRGNAVTASVAEQDDGILGNIEVPIYINGIYTRKEIIQIARDGISRQMINTNAAKGMSPMA